MKRLSIVLVCIGLVAMLVGCSARSESNFSVYADDETNTVRIGATNASENSSGRVGALIVGDGEKVIVKPSLLRGTILVRFTTSDEDTENTTPIKPVRLEVSGFEEQTCELPAGTYDVYALVTEAADGVVLVGVGSELKYVS